MMKKLAVTLLALALLALPLGAGAENKNIDDAVPAAPVTEAAESEGARMEGPGFAAPEEAVSAYIAGLQHGDLAEMLSAFALESYVDAFDLKTYTDSLKTYQFATMPLPAQGDLARQLNLETRRSEIVTAIRWQYASLALEPEAQSDDILRPVPLLDVDVAGFLDSWFKDEGEAYIADIAFDGDFLQGLAWVLAPNYYTQKGLMNLGRSAARCGADGVRDVAALVKVGGKDHILFAAAYRYGDRWYVGQLGGILAMTLGLNSTCGMLVPASELTRMDDAAFEALWQQYKNDAQLMELVADWDALVDGIDWEPAVSARELDAVTAAQLEALSGQIQERLDN